MSVFQDSQEGVFFHTKALDKNTETLRVLHDYATRGARRFGVSYVQFRLDGIDVFFGRKAGILFEHAAEIVHRRKGKLL